jgi:hypothetical protein
VHDGFVVCAGGDVPTVLAGTLTEGLPPSCLRVLSFWFRRADTRSAKMSLDGRNVRVAESAEGRGRAMAGSEIVAVIDANEGGIIVWWANLGPSSGAVTDRLCGAWTVDPEDVDTLRSVVSGEVCLTTDAGREAIEQTGVVPGPPVDATATLEAMVAERDRLQAAFDAEAGRRRSSRELIAPQWPDLPSPLDVNHPPPIDAPPAVHNALSLARWLVNLAACWDGIEDQRGRRKWLRDIDGAGTRAMPVVIGSRA